MREKKFRAWDKKNKSMIDFDFALSPTGSLLKYQDKTGCWGETHSKEEIELMQYTGLKDKNGKEIYEGDIVKYITGYDTKKEPQEQSNIGVVEYDEPYAMFAVNGLGFIRLQLFPTEIIGNIYSNPELLN